MKKLIGVVVLILSILLIVGCGTFGSLDIKLDTIERVDDEKVVLMMKINSGSGVEGIRYKVMIIIDGEFIADVGEYAVYELVQEVTVPVWVGGEKVTEMQKKFDEIIGKEDADASYNLEKYSHDTTIPYIKAALTDYDKMRRIEERLEELEAEVYKWREIRHRFSVGGVIWEDDLVDFFRNYIEIKVVKVPISEEPVGTIDLIEADEGWIMAGIGERFNVVLPKADNPSHPNQGWILINETPRLEKVSISRDGEEEIWTFRALRVGHVSLEFSWSLLHRGVWPSDERKIIEIEVR